MHNKINKRLLVDLKMLIKEAKENFFLYISDGFLNTEGKKIQILILKKYASVFNDKKYFNYFRKNREEDFLRMLKFIEEEIDSRAL